MGILLYLAQILQNKRTIMNFIKTLPIFLFFIIIACKNDPPFDAPSKKANDPPTIPKTLPKRLLDLSDLSSFKVDGQNWIIGGAVYSDLKQKHSLKVEEGKGLLINQPTETNKSNIMTNWEHGDIDLEIDFMVPKGSNSGIYLQGRYELQILDSWGKETVSSSDCGGIYQRWDETKPEGQKGFEGTAPTVNASKAPGLWQNFKIEFQAPRFDEQGKKIQNAIFKKVYLNDFLIHDNIELSGPTRGAAIPSESATGPLFIQGDHGPIAFKNIKFKTYTKDKLSLTDISYEFYDGKDDKLPDFSQLTPIKTGQIDSLDIRKASDQADGYRLKFTGKLEVPVEGEYLFSTRIDDGGELLIDGKSIVFNEGTPGYGEERGLVQLTKGVHDFAMTYYQEIWGALLVVDYEGPGMIKQSLASKMPVYSWQKKRPPILVTDLKKPEMLRAFVNHKGEKRTNILSVGDPEGVHYSYDLRTANLIKTWKGQFANVTKMWQGRGEPQLLQPMNTSIDLIGGFPIAVLKNEGAVWPSYISDDFKFKGYEIDENNRPTFLLNFKSTQFKDKILPSKDGKGLIRTISKEGEEPNLYLRVAAAAKIQQLPNGLYSIDGLYYIKGTELLVRNENELLAKMKNEVRYEIHW